MGASNRGGPHHSVGRYRFRDHSRQNRGGPTVIYFVSGTESPGRTRLRPHAPSCATCSRTRISEWLCRSFSKQPPTNPEAALLRIDLCGSASFRGWLQITAGHPTADPAIVPEPRTLGQITDSHQISNTRNIRDSDYNSASGSPQGSFPR